MSKKSEKLFDGITRISDEVLGKAAAVSSADSKRTKKKSLSGGIVMWIRTDKRKSALIAAALVVAVTAGFLLGRDPLSVYAVTEVTYPKDSGFYEYGIYTEEVSGFLKATIPEFLSETDDKNIIYSPLNVYMALSMLAEITDGNSRRQILNLLGADTIGIQRQRANTMWNVNYQDDREGKSILASSLWLDESIDYDQNTLDILAENYYAASYYGRMGSDGFNRAMVQWLNEQTGGLLKKQIPQELLSADTVLALASTVYFKASWSKEFSSRNTRKQTFHGTNADELCDFMHQDKLPGDYYWGEHFSAVEKSFTTMNTMWFILPDEGFTPEDLLQDEEFMRFLTVDELTRWKWDNSRHLYVNLAVPKFDVSSNLDLIPGLSNLGVTDVLNYTVSDFSPLSRAYGANDAPPTTTDQPGLYLSEATHASRVVIDEEGCKAASYVEFGLKSGSAAPPTDEIDFVVDRPFLFFITSSEGLPMFVGIVKHP